MAKARAANSSMWIGILVLVTVFVSIFYWPPVYDEGLYRSFSEAFARIGKPYLPQLPDGYFLVFHPYLVALLQSLWIRLGLESVVNLRVLHFLFWVIPSVWLTGRLARDLLESERAAAGALAFLLTATIFLQEAITAELDMPYTLIILLSAWLTWRWHNAARQGGVFSRDWALLTVVLGLGMWIKFQCALAMASTVLLTLGLILSVHAAPRRRIFLALAFSVSTTLSSFGLWVLYADSLGAPVFQGLVWVTQGLKGDLAVYRSTVSGFSWGKYMVFAAAYMNVAMFGAAGIGLCRAWKMGLLRRTAYVWIPASLIILSLLASGIREVRYLDPALPLFCILGSVVFRKGSHESALHARSFWIPLLAAFGTVSVLFAFRENLPTLPVSGFKAQWFKLAAIGSCAIALIPAVFRSSGRMRLLAAGLLLGASAGAGWESADWFFKPVDPAVKEFPALNLRVRALCRDRETFVLYRQAIAYGLTCPYLSADFLKKFPPPEAPKATYWVLPTGLGGLPPEIDTKSFSTWLTNNYLPMETPGLAHHRIWTHR